MSLISIGKITGTHHLKGSIKVTSNFDDLGIIIGSKIIVKNRDGASKILTVSSIKKIGPKKLIFDFIEINNKTDGIKFYGYFIYARKDILGLKEDEYYNSEIIGMRAVDINGDELGIISDILETNAHDIYIIGEGKNEIMVPDCVEFVKNINFDDKIVTFELIEGMNNKESEESKKSRESKMDKENKDKESKNKESEDKGIKK